MRVESEAKRAYAVKTNLCNAPIMQKKKIAAYTDKLSVTSKLKLVTDNLPSSSAVLTANINIEIIMVTVQRMMQLRTNHNKTLQYLTYLVKNTKVHIWKK